MAAELVPSSFRNRIAGYLSLSLAIGWSAAAALHMAPVTATNVASATPQATSLSNSASFAPSSLTPPKSKAKAKVSRTLAQPMVEPLEPSRAIVSNHSGRLIVDANEILLTDHRRPRVATALFGPVKQALIAYQATSKSPEVTIVASNKTPVTYVRAVEKFMTKFYGWKVVVNQAGEGELFQVQVDSKSGNQ